jgi:DNA-binding winged helix-turn-helix (wHTH) protein
MLRVQFGPFCFDSARWLLLRRGEPVHLTRKAFLLLALLIERRPCVVTKNQILDCIWPDCHVSENSVANLISEIRGALGRQAPDHLRTVHGVGYAFEELSELQQAGYGSTFSGLVSETDPR